MIYDRECPRCDGSGEIAYSVYSPCPEVGPGPVPDDAKGITGRACPRCGGSGVEEVDLEDMAE